MNNNVFLFLALTGLFACSEKQAAYKPSSASPVVPEGYRLAWHDEFNTEGKPDSASWTYEYGFVRNNELQWYQPENANCVHGVLVMEGKREKVENQYYDASSNDWRKNRKFAAYPFSGKGS